VVRTPPGVHHPGLKKNQKPRRLVNPHPRPEGARLSGCKRDLIDIV
jgi:hypothetical protein